MKAKSKDVNTVCDLFVEVMCKAVCNLDCDPRKQKKNTLHTLVFNMA